MSGSVSEDLREHIVELETEMAKLRSELINSQKETTEEASRRKQSEREIQELRQMLEDGKRTIAEQDLQVKLLESKVHGLQSDLFAAQLGVQAKDAEILAARQRNEQLVRTIADLQAKLSETEAQQYKACVCHPLDTSAIPVSIRDETVRDKVNAFRAKHGLQEPVLENPPTSTVTSEAESALPALTAALRALSMDGLAAQTDALLPKFQALFPAQMYKIVSTLKEIAEQLTFDAEERAAALAASTAAAGTTVSGIVEGPSMRARVNTDTGRAPRLVAQDAVTMRKELDAHIATITQLIEQGCIGHKDQRAIVCEVIDSLSALMQLQSTAEEERIALTTNLRMFAEHVQAAIRGLNSGLSDYETEDAKTVADLAASLHTTEDHIKTLLKQRETLLQALSTCNSQLMEDRNTVHCLSSEIELLERAREDVRATVTALTATLKAKKENATLTAQCADGLADATNEAFQMVTATMTRQLSAVRRLQRESDGKLGGLMAEGGAFLDKYLVQHLRNRLAYLEQRNLQMIEEGLRAHEFGLSPEEIEKHTNQQNDVAEMIDRMCVEKENAEKQVKGIERDRENLAAEPAADIESVVATIGATEVDPVLLLRALALCDDRALPQRVQEWALAQPASIAMKLVRLLLRGETPDEVTVLYDSPAPVAAVRNADAAAGAAPAESPKKK